MARIRSIKPETFTDSDLGELPPLHRWLYVGMWGHADCEGKLLDKPRELRVKILPYDDGADADAMLWDLAEAGFLIRYECGGVRYLIIPSLPKHQKFHRDEKPKGYPHVAASTVLTRCQHPASTLPALGQHPARSAVNGELCTVNGERGSVNESGGTAVSTAARALEKKSEPSDPKQTTRGERPPTPPPPATERVSEVTHPTPLDVIASAWRRVKGVRPTWATSTLAERALQKLPLADFTNEQLDAMAERAFQGQGFDVNGDPVISDVPGFIRHFDRYVDAAAPPAATGPPPRPCAVCGEPSSSEIWGQRVCPAHWADWVETKGPENEDDMRLWVEARKGNAA